MSRGICRYYFSALQKICEKIYGRNRKGGKVFVFHQVTDDKVSWADANCSISKKGFEELISALCDGGVVFGSMDELAEAGYDSKVFLTFDDIFGDAVVNAMPYLVERQIPFCIFVTENYVGQEGYVTEEQLKALLEEPLCTVGYHTKKHIMMRGSSREDIRNEISCHSFVEKYHFQPVVFAYPFGSAYACNFYSMEEAKRQGYRYGFSTIAVPVTRWAVKYAKYFMPRININESNYRKYVSNI